MSGIGRHRLLQLLADAAIVAVSWVLAFELRFDHGLPVYYDTLLRRTILIVVAIKLAVFIMFGFHRRWWRYVSVRDMWSAARGVVVASLVADVTVYFVSPVHGLRLPRSIAAMDLLITLALVAGARLQRARSSPALSGPPEQAPGQDAISGAGRIQDQRLHDGTGTSPG